MILLGVAVRSEQINGVPDCREPFNPSTHNYAEQDRTHNYRKGYHNLNYRSLS